MGVPMLDRGGAGGGAVDARGASEGAGASGSFPHVRSACAPAGRASEQDSSVTRAAMAAACLTTPRILPEAAGSRRGHGFASGWASGCAAATNGSAAAASLARFTRGSASRSTP